MVMGPPLNGFSAALPKKISSIVISIGGLAVFLIFGSWILISYPIGSSNFFHIDQSVKPDLTSPLLPLHGSTDTTNKQTPPASQQAAINSEPVSPSVSSNVINSKPVSPPFPSSDIDSKPVSPPASSNVIDAELVSPPDSSNVIDATGSDVKDSGSDPGLSNEISVNTSNSTLETLLPSSLTPSNNDKVGSGSCDLYHGKWIYDSSGPLYTNNTCPVLTQMQNCQGNGRPDKDYENWRWKPRQCDLPRFDPKKFLELMRGKTLAFIGDSVARNQMESMLCILWQVEAPKNRGNKRMQRWYFRSTSTMIVRIWSSWLVHRTSDPFDFAPGGVDKLHLDAPDEGFMDVIPSFDVVVLSSGHWFAKQSVYILNNEIVGGQLWWPDKKRPMKVNNIEAFGISVETILTALGTHSNYTGLTIVRSYSPDHYEGGAWNTGGSCTGKVRPVAEGELVANEFTNIMHKKQVNGFNKAIEKTTKTKRSKLILMDITEAFGYRHDGHPGPYRNPDPNKITKRGPNGQPPPQDCLHWCMPGPVDTWNELVLEIIRREYEGTTAFPA